MKTKAKNRFFLSVFLQFWVLFSFITPGNHLNAQWSDNPQVNNPIITLPISNQFSPAIAKDGAAGAIIVWVDSRSSGETDLYAQRILDSGTLAWISTGTPIAIADNNQESPAIVSSDSGYFFVAWQDRRNDPSENQILVQRFTASGEPQWPLETLAHTGNNSPPLIIPDNNSGVITASYITSLDDDLIAYQILGNDGRARFNPRGIVSLTAKGRQPDLRPAVTAGLNGGLIAAWVDTRNDTVVFAKGILSNGSAWAADETIGESVADETFPAIVSDGNQGAIIVWIQPTEGNQDDIVRAIRLDENGVLVWTDNIININTTSGKKRNLTITADGQNGGYLVWENSVATNPQLYLQRIKNNGEFWDNDVALSIGAGQQIKPVITHNGRGSALVAWEDDRNGNSDIFAQSVDSTGQIVWNANGVAVSTAVNSQTNPVLVDDGLGGAVIVWEDMRTGTDADVYAQRVSVTGVLGEFRTVTVDAPASGEVWEMGSSQVISWMASPEIDSVKIELSRDGGQQFDETLFASLPNTNPENNQVTLTPVPGPASTQCKIRISVISAPFIFSVSPVFTISPSEGPQLDPLIVTESTFGDTLEITSTALDISGVRQVFLNYRLGGARSFVKSEMQQLDDNQFSGAVPSRFLTERGLDYFVSGTDSIGAMNVTDTFFVAVDFDSGVETKTVAIGSAQTAYRMISAPNLLEQTLADSIFTVSGFGVYDTTSWRLFEFRDGLNVERDSLNITTFQFEPGRAYWLISARARTVDFGSGTSIRADTTYSISLKPGWNQVGNPFAFAVAWDDIAAASGDALVSLPSFYRGSYIIPRALNPYEGYFIFNFEEQNVTLTFPPREFQPTAQLAKNQTESGWKLQICSACQEARDDFNFIGVHEQAAVDWDRLDQPEPPPIGEFISVYFPKTDWDKYPNNYTTDYRDKIGKGQTWIFRVQTNIPNSEAKLQFSGLESLPQDLEVMLVDEKLTITRDLRAHQNYSFPTGNSGTTKTLKLMIGKNDYLSDAISGVKLIPSDFELSQNFPNPFNPATSIRYGLPKSEEVTIRIFDLLGKEVKILIDGERQEAGYHIVSWNGKDKRDLPVASGLYIYQIKSGNFSQTRKMLLVK